MRHRYRVKSLNKPHDHRDHMLRNMATSLLMYEKINTTLAKARVLRQVVEPLITYSKKNDAKNTIRKLNSYLYHENASRKILEVYKDRYSNRPGGFTRIVKTGYRKGDGALMANISMI